jgi:nucleotide-binding universal stress UspA family protein
MRIERVAVGDDFSDEAGIAAAHAVALARRHAAALTLIHVESAADPLTLGIAPDGGAMPVYQQLHDEALAAGRARLDERAAALAAAHGIAIETAVAAGFPEETLAALARERRVDLLAIGTHGRTGLGRALLGSVAEKVVRLATGAVLVARGEAPRDGYRRILVPTDFSPLAGRALDAALALAADDAEIVLFHGWQLPGAFVGGAVTEPVLAPVRQVIEDGARAQAEAALAGRPEDPRIRFELGEGAPTRAIEARGADRDLIAIGSHGRRGVRRWLLGSLAEATVRTAHCSVVVVHGGGDGG